MGVHQSRYELERILGRYGASDFAFVEADSRASIQFAMHGRYVQLALPLPDPSGVAFTHTPSGRPRAIVAQERAYEQALREHWRALVLAVRGKLQSVESGISTFEEEFKGFLVPQFHEQKGKRRAPKAVNWLLGGSHTIAIGLVAAFFVPASAVGAFALPPSVVDHLSAPFRSSAPADQIASSDGSGAVASRGSDWTIGNSVLARSTSVSAHGDSASLGLVVPSRGSPQPGLSPATTETAPVAGGNAAPAVPTALEPNGGSQGNGSQSNGSQSNNPAPASSGPSSNAGPPSPPPPSNGGGNSDNTSTSGGNNSSSSGSAGGASPPPDGGATADSGTSANESNGSGGPATSPEVSSSQPPANGGASGGGSSTGGHEGATGGTTSPPTDKGNTPSTPQTSHDNGNHNGKGDGNGNGNGNGNANGNGSANDKPSKDKPKGKP